MVCIRVRNISFFGFTALDRRRKILSLSRHRPPDNRGRCDNFQLLPQAETMPIQPFSRSQSCESLDDDIDDDIDDSIDDVACSFVSKRDEYNHQVGNTTELELKEHFERRLTLRLLCSDRTTQPPSRTLSSESVDDPVTTSACMTRECLFRLLPENKTRSVSEQLPEQAPEVSEQQIVSPPMSSLPTFGITVSPDSVRSQVIGLE